MWIVLRNQREWAPVLSIAGSLSRVASDLKRGMQNKECAADNASPMIAERGLYAPLATVGPCQEA